MHGATTTVPVAAAGAGRGLAPGRSRPWDGLGDGCRPRLRDSTDSLQASSGPAWLPCPVLSPPPCLGSLPHPKKWLVRQGGAGPAGDCWCPDEMTPS